MLPANGLLLDLSIWQPLAVAAVAALIVLAWRIRPALVPVHLASLASAVTAVSLGLFVILLLNRPQPHAPRPVTGPKWGITSAVTPAISGSYRSWSVPSQHGFLTNVVAGPGGHVWTAERGTNQLEMLTPEAGTVTEFGFPVSGAAPTEGVAIDARGHIWLTQGGIHGIGRFNPRTGGYRDFPIPTVNASPFGIAIDRTGRVWFAESGSNKLGVLTPSSGSIVEYDLPPAATAPYWLAVAPDGRIWFTTLTAPLLGVLDPTDGNVSLIPVAMPDTGGADGTTGIDVAADGALWAGLRSGRLLRVDPTTHEVKAFPLPRGQAYGVAIAKNGLVWVATTGASVAAFDPAAKTFCSVPTGDGAWWVSAADDGAIWVSQAAKEANAIGRIAPDLAAHPCR